MGKVVISENVLDWKSMFMLSYVAVWEANVQNLVSVPSQDFWNQ